MVESLIFASKETPSKIDKEKIVKKILENVPLHELSKALDVGCGDGDYCNIFLKKGLSTVVGIDIDIASLKKGKQVCSDAEFICADAYFTPFRPGTFNLVLCKDLLHHIYANKREEIIHKLSLLTKQAIIFVEAKLLNPVLFAFFYLMGHRHFSDAYFKKLSSNFDATFFSISGVYPFPSSNRGEKIINFFRRTLFFIPSYNIAIIFHVDKA